MGKSTYLEDLQKKPSTQSAGQAATNDVMRITNDLIDNNYKERAAESQRQNDSMIDNVNQHLDKSGKGLVDSFIQSGKDIKDLFTPKDLDVEVSASESIQSFVKTILIATNAIVNPINSAVTMATDAATAYMDYAENFLLNNKAAIITQDVVNTIHDFTKVASEVGFGSALTHYSANFIFEGLGHIPTGSEGWDRFLSGTGAKASEIFSSFFGAHDSQTLARYVKNFESERQQKAIERKNYVPYKEMQYYTIVDGKLILTKHTIVDGKLTLTKHDTIHAKSTANVQSDAIKARNSNYSAFNNSAIKQLLQANADLLTNMFDIAIVTTNKDDEHQTNSLITMFQPNVKVGSSATDLQLTKVQSSMMVNASTIPVRTASITIPQSTTNTSQISFIEEKIEIPGSTVSFSNEATMSIELDANNYVFEMFQGLAGMKMPGRVLDASGNLRNNDFKIQAAITNSNDRTIDIVVEAKRLHGYDDNGKVLANGKLKKLLLFVFEDVRFLGSSDGINFERNAAGLVTKNISFIFKRISKVYSSLVNEG